MKIKKRTICGIKATVYKPQHYWVPIGEKTYEVYASEWGRQWKCWRIKGYERLTFQTLTQAIEFIKE